MAGKDFDFGALVEEAEASAGTDKDVLGALLSTEEDDPDAQMREQLSDADIGNLDEEFQTVALLTKKRDELDRKLKQVKQDLQAAKNRMMDSMEAQGTNQFRSGAGLGSCYLQERFDTTLEDPDLFLDWIKARHPELLSVHSQTRNRFIREEYRDKGVDPGADEFPPGVAVTPRKQLAVRGAKVKQSGRDKEKAK